MITHAFTYEYFKELKKIRRRKIIFFNGVFDIIHNGHLKMINNIKRLSKNQGEFTYIVCGLNSNKSVSKLNKIHPLINDEKDRAEFIENLGIDYVFVFDEETPTPLIMNITPDIIIKGSDYKFKEYDEKDYIKQTSTEIVYIDLEKGKSTSNIYNKIYNLAKEDIRRKLDE